MKYQSAYQAKLAARPARKRSIAASVVLSPSSLTPGLSRRRIAICASVSQRNGLSREDLFFRLNVIPIRLPALREQTEDIESDCNSPSLRKHCESDTGMLKTLDKEVLEAFQKYPWPGNVRELPAKMWCIRCTSAGPM